MSELSASIFGRKTYGGRCTRILCSKDVLPYMPLDHELSAGISCMRRIPSWIHGLIVAMLMSIARVDDLNR